MAGDTLRLHTLIELSAATSVTDWINTSFKYDPLAERLLYGSLTSGDTIEVEIAVSNGDAPTYTRIVKTYTSTGFDDVLYGPIPRIRFKKTGTTGTAWVVLVK